MCVCTVFTFIVLRTRYEVSKIGLRPCTNSPTDPNLGSIIDYWVNNPNLSEAQMDYWPIIDIGPQIHRACTCACTCAHDWAPLNCMHMCVHMHIHLHAHALTCACPCVCTQTHAHTCGHVHVNNRAVGVFAPYFGLRPNGATPLHLDYWPQNWIIDVNISIIGLILRPISRLLTSIIPILLTLKGGFSPLNPRSI